ncbi:MAG: dihydropteroate synthase [Synergistales bacterium]|nr:dihydropteroate synthase [Synergistales bacterium]
MPYWGLGELKSKLQAVLQRTSRKHWTLSLRGGKDLPLGEDPVLMGIVNLTEDSFYPGSRIRGELSALDKAREMILQGASIIDLGAESTRPGATPLSAEDELSRLIPAISLISREIPQAIISVDTYKSEVAKEAILAGAHMINDIYGLGFDPRVATVAAETGAVLVINHIQGTPRDMQEHPYYGDTLAEILEHLQERVNKALAMGVPGSGIIIDPGIGFGKKLEDNLSILRHIGSFRSLGYPIMLGYSRKGFIGRICDQPDPTERLEGTLALTALSTLKGVQILRVHDVKENLSVIRMIKTVKEEVLK